LASASASSLRAFRSSLSALGLAALLAAFPLAALVPFHAAFAEPAAAQATVAVAQQAPNDPNQPKNPPIDTDPDDAPWPGDDDEDNPPNQPPVDQGVQPAVPNTQPSDVPTEKATPALPDSVLKAKTLPHAGGGALDTLEFKPAGAGAKRPPLAPKPVERRPYFGLHPAVFFLGLLAGHIFLVRAITG